MPSASEIFGGLERGGPTFHGIVRPDPDAPGNVLFSPHRHLRQQLSIPAEQIASITKSGETHGLSPDHHAVSLTLRNTALEDPNVGADLNAMLRSSDMIDSVPVYCYNGQKWVPCNRT